MVQKITKKHKTLRIVILYKTNKTLYIKGFCLFCCVMFFVVFVLLFANTEVRENIAK